MSNSTTILCPVDFSEDNAAAIELATTIAKQTNATIQFLYASPLWLAEESRFSSQYINQLVAEEKKKLFEVKPSDPSVEFEHLYVNGNAGQLIVNASKEADSIVMSTHGRSGIAKLVLGSVAFHVLRNAHCPVVLVKDRKVEKEHLKERFEDIHENDHVVSEIMHRVDPIRGSGDIDDARAILNDSAATALPVVDDCGKCIGVLTETNLENYRDLKARYDAKDESVIDQIFEIDEFGQRRTNNTNFHTVKRHMTKDVVSLHGTDAIEEATALFDSRPKLHQLVILDENGHPIGIVDCQRVVDAIHEFS
jgi:nucleotide-binding universal stress UspA family protein/CBS domain-containing protein